MAASGDDLALNRRFLQKSIPHRTLCESAPSYLKILDRHYFSVEHDEAALKCSKKDKKNCSKVIRLEEGVTHLGAPLAESKDCVLVRTLI